jgi:hypothetical protein
LLQKAAIALTTAALLIASTNAFGDFAPTETRVLGVGRIQSNSSTVPVAATERLVMISPDDNPPAVASVTELAAPIDREVGRVDAPPPTISSQVGNASGFTEWQSGLASAYGGADIGTYMAYGEEQLGPDSMGVAVPTSWWRLLGHHMEVEYNGIVVTVLINDTGPFAQRGRSLDLQPGVWKAFGFDSLWDWGVREVRFRVID